MSTPRTEAGRKLLELISNLSAALPLEVDGQPIPRLDIEATLRIILAIEAEARSEGHKEGYLSRAQDERIADEAGEEAIAEAFDKATTRRVRSAGAVPLESDCDCDCHLCDCYLRHAEGTDR